jgi:hypothetical protein
MVNRSRKKYAFIKNDFQRLPSWSLLFVLLFFTNAFAGTKNYQLELWQVKDIRFESTENPDAPFEVDFGAVFFNASGKELNIPGFYDGRNHWVIRISLNELGDWKYQTYSSLNSLNGFTGSINVVENTKPDRRGPAQISKKNPQRFEYEDGTTYFPLAFEIDWLFALDADNPNDIPKTRQIVGHIKDHRFNQVIMNVYAYYAPWHEVETIDPRHNFAEPLIFPFGGNNKEPDHNTLNVEFFQHFDRVMDHLHQQEITARLMIYVWNKLVNWPKPGSEQDNRYFEYVVKRYQAYPNLIWDVSKEALAYGMDDMDYITLRIDRLRNLDAHKRLLTVHDYDYCRSNPHKVDFISVQEWIPNLYDEMLRLVERHKDMPVFNVEHGGYEKTMHSIFIGAFNDPVKVLERTYETIFAGTYSAYYWQNTSWYEVVYDPFELPEENQPNFAYYKYLMEFFDQYDFNQLKPAQYFYSPYVLTDDYSLFIYLASDGISAIQGTPPPAVQNKTVEVVWFDPLKGKYHPTETRNIINWTGFRKPPAIESPFALAILKIKE